MWFPYLETSGLYLATILLSLVAKFSASWAGGPTYPLVTALTFLTVKRSPTHDAVLLGFFRPPRRSLFVMHLPGREPHREPHTLTFFTIATSSNAPSEGNPRSPHREGLKADPSTIHEVAWHYGMPPSGVDLVRSR